MTSGRSRESLWRIAGSAIVAGLSVAVLAGLVDDSTSNAEVPGSHIALMGTTIVGGRVAEPADAEGTRLWVEQSQVHYYLPMEGQRSPIVMVPGMNLSSYVYRATPDGRKAWAQHFAEAGFDVYTFDDPLASSSGGFDINRFNEVKSGSRDPSEQAGLSIWDMEHVWPRWGFGPEYGTAYPDVRFPTDSADQFYAALPFVHERAGGGRGGGVAVANLVALLDQIGEPVVLMGHSAGSGTTGAAAAQRPESVLAFVLVEPAGGIPDGGDFPGNALLGVYGDYIAERRQTGRKEATMAAAASFQAAGGRGQVISLPDDHSIHGNTHIMMQDDNNLVIADIIIDWLTDEPRPESLLSLPQLVRGAEL